LAESAFNTLIGVAMAPPRFSSECCLVSTRSFLGLVLLGLALGCRQAPVPLGGTTGRITLGGDPLAEVRVDVLDGSRQVVGFGQTDAHGEYSLVSRDGKTPLTLPAGRHGVTLAPLGPVAPPLPPDSIDAAKTALTIEVGADGKASPLEVPPSKQASTRPSRGG
jgi:hypothetical protein